MELSIVIPVYNEAENICPLIDEIQTALDGYLEYEILYVNDGSKDDTAAILEQLSQTSPRLRFICHQVSCGQSTAIHTGVKYARANWIATLDGDGQNDPADIPKLIEARDADTSGSLELISGYRRKRRDTWLKRISSKIANGVRSQLLQDHTPDTGCGLKLFKRSTFIELPYFDHMHRFMAALIIRNGGQVMSVEVNHRSRTKGVSKYGFHDRLWVGIVDLFGVIWLQRRAKLPIINVNAND